MIKVNMDQITYLQLPQEILARFRPCLSNEDQGRPDERRLCSYALTGVRPQTCPNFAIDEHSPGGFCRLNAHDIAAWGYEIVGERTPCVFDEPPGAEIWRRVARERGKR